MKILEKGILFGPEDREKVNKLSKDRDLYGYFFTSKGEVEKETFHYGPKILGKIDLWQPSPYGFFDGYATEYNSYFLLTKVEAKTDVTKLVMDILTGKII